MTQPHEPRVTLDRPPYDQRGGPFVQLSFPRLWLGTPPNGWPFVRRPKYGNQLHRWSLWIRLPGNCELQVHGRPLR